MTCRTQSPYSQEARDLAHALCEEYAAGLALYEMHRAVAFEAFWMASPIIYPSRRAMLEALWGGDR